MASTPEHPLDGQDLAKLRAEIDELQAIPEEQLLSPVPTGEPERELEAEPTDAIGSEEWTEPATPDPSDK